MGEAEMGRGGKGRQFQTEAIHNSCFPLETPLLHVTSGVNLPGILGDEEDDSKGLVGRRSMMWDRPSPLPRKNDFSLKMACF